MERIIVQLSLNFDPSKGNFEEMRQKEGVQLMKWKEEGILENFFIRSDKSGAMLIFKDLEKDQAIKNVEGLPLYPHMAKVEFIEFDKKF